MYNKKPSCVLEEKLFDSIDKKTPDYIKNNNLINLDDKGEITFVLKKEHLENYNEQTNPEGLGLQEWLNSYEKEAKVSTGGIRGPQNILYPWDTRFPINVIGVLLATLAKSMVANEKYAGKDLHKIAATEVRYNSPMYLDLISRVQAAQNVTTHVPQGRKTIPIWLASFLAFKLDLIGGEYITSSHGISVKIATKDLNNQGSQYLPEESIEFVNKIKEIFENTRKNGTYEIKIASSDDKFIREDAMAKLNNGIDLYAEYLKNGVATDLNIDLIKNIQNKVVIDSVGGCSYQTLSKLLENLDIQNSFEWLNTGEDPFFHSIGKQDTDPKTGSSTFYDWSLDTSVVFKTKDGKLTMPVIESLNYAEILKDKPVGTVIFITDPDHDRLSVVQIESKENISKLENAGIDYLEMKDGRILSVFSANQVFLMIIDFYAKGLKASNKWNNHPRFMIKTTASAMAWDEWANVNGVKVLNCPVGFKEIANLMKKVEKQIIEAPEKEVIVEDVYGKEINLGVNPRLLFGGEESGGMIIGPEELIKSKNGRIAIAMREKSATEAIFITAALVGALEKEGKTLIDNLQEVFEKNKIIGKFDVREDVSYYNESEPDIEALKIAKKAGEALRTQNDMFYLSIAMAKREDKISLENAKEIFVDAFPELDFSNLTDVKFVGDGTYLEFTDKYIEIRPSGTDAKTKSYGAGSDKAVCKKYAAILGNFAGVRTDKHKQYIDDAFYNNAKELSLETYGKWAMKGSSEEKFEIPDYSKSMQGVF